MIIKKLKLRGFGKFTDKTVTFSPGFNLITGPNEVGKTTIQAALYTAFFAKPKDYERWGRPGASCRLELIYEVKGGVYDLQRNLDSDKVSLKTPAGEVLTKKRRVKEEIYRNLGSADEKIFENTAFVRTSELAALEDGDNKAVKSRIEALLTGSRQVSAAQALTKLRRAYQETAGNTRQHGRGGRIGELDERLQSLTSSLNAARASRERLAELKERRRKLVEELSAKNRELRRWEPLLAAVDVYNERREIQKKRQALSRRIAEIEALAAESAKRQKVAESPLASLPANSRQLTRQRRAMIKDKEMLLSSLEKDLSNYSGGGDNPRRGWMSYTAAALIFLIGSAVALFYQALPGLLIISAAAAFLVWTLISRAGKASQPSIGLTESITRLKREIDELRRLQEEMLAAAGVDDADEFDKKYTTWLADKQAVERLREKREIMLAGETIETLKERRVDLYDQEEIISRKLDPKAEKLIADLTPADIFSRRRQIEELKAEIKDLQREKFTADGQIKEFSANKEADVNDLEAEIDFQKSQLAAEEERAAALQLAAAQLQAVKDDLSRQAAPELARGADEYFHEFVSGDPRKVVLNEQLEVDLKTVDSDYSVRLSTGTRDQLFLALRLAVSRVLFADLKPPLILDDPFVYFDRERLRRTLASLMKISRRQQVILFSHADVSDYLSGDFNLLVLE